MSFWTENKEYFINAGFAVLVLLVAFAIYRAARLGVNRFMVRRHLRELDPGAVTRFRMLVRLFAVVLFFVAIGLALWILDISALRRVAVGMFASAGVAGIALGFAAQTTVANLVTGIIIAFVQPLRLGDRVNLEGEYGVVEDIGLFYTRIRTWDNRRLIIPNKLLADRVIRNYTLEDPRMPALVHFYLPIGTDLSKVREILLSLACSDTRIIKEPPPVVEVIDCDATSVIVRLAAWVEDQDKASRVAADLREQAFNRLVQEGVIIRGS